MMRARIGAILAVVAVVLASAGPVHAGTMTIDDAGTVRVGGTDRYGTAVELSRRSFTPPVAAVFVATGTQFADALSSGPAARATGPVLLARPDSVPDLVVSEIERLQPQTIYVLGGTAALSDAVVATLGEHAPVERLAGPDRYATAAAVSAAFWPSTLFVYLATGAQFTDALSGGAAAAKGGVPVLLTRTSTLPDSTAVELARLAPLEVRLLGGTAAVGETVAQAVRAILPDTRIVRLAGADRYATAAAVAGAIWPDGSERAFVATGTAFADAVAAVPAAAVNGGAPLLLARGACTPDVTVDALSDLRPATRVLVGGTAALADGVLKISCEDLRQPPFFVYGTLREGQSGYYLIDGTTTKEVLTRMPGLDLYRLSTSSYPYAVPNSANATGIVGEAVSIEPESYTAVMARLDRYERYDPTEPPDNQTYVRELRPIHTGVPSWVYVAGPRQASYLRSSGILITSGDWLRW